MHTRTSTAPDIVTHIHTQNHAQTNERACTNDARMHTHANSTHLEYAVHSDTKIWGDSHRIHIHIHIHTYTHTHIHTYTYACMHTPTHGPTHTNSIDRELVRPIHVLRVSCPWNIEGEIVHTSGRHLSVHMRWKTKPSPKGYFFKLKTYLLTHRVLFFGPRASKHEWCIKQRVPPRPATSAWLVTLAGAIESAQSYESTAHAAGGRLF